MTTQRTKTKQDRAAEGTTTMPETAETAGQRLPAPSAEDRRKLAIYQKMPEALQKAFPVVRKLFGCMINGDLVATHDIGKAVMLILQQERIYGSHAVEELAKLLDIPPTRLFWCRDLTKIFSRKEIEDLAAQRLPDGGPVTLDLLHVLYAIRPAARRQFWLGRLLQENFSPRRLLRAAQDAGDIKVVPSRPRDKRQPSAMVAAKQLAAAAERFRHQSGSVRENLFMAVDEMAPAQVNEELQDLLHKALTEVDVLAGLAAWCRTRLEKNLVRVDRVLRLRQQEQEATKVPPQVSGPTASAT